jgi:hypothetical protein
MLRDREAMWLNEITLLPAIVEVRRTPSDFAQKVTARRFTKSQSPTNVEPHAVHWWRQLTF